MFSSLPDYCRLAESVLPRLRKDSEQRTPNRLRRMALNLVLLAGLWGLPLYARWMVLADRNPPQEMSDSLSQHPSEDILGKWRKDESNSILEFSRKGELRLIGQQEVVESADYRIVGDELEVSGFRQQPDDRLLTVNQQRYQIITRGDRLLIKPAPAGFTSVPLDRSHAADGSLRYVLPPWSGQSSKFHRVKDR